MEPTPDADARGAAQAPVGRRSAAQAATAAGTVCLLHAVLLLVLAGFYGLELVRGEGSSATTVAMSGVLILLFAALLAILARRWFLGWSRAAVPTFVWNALLVPVVVALYGADQALFATGLLVLVLGGVLTAAVAAGTGRRTG